MVAPTLTMSEERARTEPFAGWARQIAERQALAGHATPGDIVGAVTFLAAEDARFITGLILPVDGGLTAASGTAQLLLTNNPQPPLSGAA